MEGATTFPGTQTHQDPSESISGRTIVLCVVGPGCDKGIQVTETSKTQWTLEAVETVSVRSNREEEGSEVKTNDYPVGSHDTHVGFLRFFEERSGQRRVFVRGTGEKPSHVVRINGIT